MKKIKVYLQFPWKFPDSPYYKYLINNLSEGIEYINVKKQKGVIINKKIFWFSNLLKKVIRKGVRIFYPSMPNAHLSPKGDYDLIHCAHCLSKNKNKPWIADIEFAPQLWVTLNAPKNKENVKKILLRKNCKKIITWTENTKKDILERFPEIEDKIEVVYPSTPVININKKKHKETNLFFVARYFYSKGGLHALEVIDRLTKKYSGVSGIIVSEVPKEIKNKYSKNKKIYFHPLMPQKDLFEKVYSIGDIFIYPGYSDSFGFAIQEVMSIGIPVVSVDISTRNEIISDKKNGFLIKTKKKQFDLVDLSNRIDSIEAKKIISKMIEKTSFLIQNPNILKKFSKNAKEEMIFGKFSAERINKKLKKIYINTIK